MNARRAWAALLLLSLAWSLVVLADSTSVQAQDKKTEKEKNPFAGKKGTVVGTLTDKGKAFIEVKADGEEKGRKYIPHWRGGAPANGGGPDKEMVKVISTLKVGSRVEVEWEHEEHFRVLKVKVLKAPEKK